MPRAQYISLYNTRLTGTIPSTFGLLTDLEGLKLHQTGLTGSVPAELCQLAQRGTLKTITIDCEKVSCDCNCTCGATDVDTFDSDLPASTSLLNPEIIGDENSTEAIQVVTVSTLAPTEAPTEVPTRATQTSAAITRTPSTSFPTVAPTNFVATQLPTSLPSALPTTVLPTTPQVSTGTVAGAAEFMLQLPDFTKEALLVPDSPQSLALLWFQADPGAATYSFRKQLQRFGKQFLCRLTCTPNINLIC